MSAFELTKSLFDYSIDDIRCLARDIYGSYPKTCDFVQRKYTVGIAQGVESLVTLDEPMFITNILCSSKKLASLNIAFGETEPSDSYVKVGYGDIKVCSAVKYIKVLGDKADFVELTINGFELVYSADRRSYVEGICNNPNGTFTFRFGMEVGGDRDITVETDDSGYWRYYMEDGDTVVSMQKAFSSFGNKESEKLVSLRFSRNFDFSKVTTFVNMFGLYVTSTSVVKCSNLRSVQGISVQKSTVSIDSMFYCCENLEIVDTAGWDTSNVTNMGSMFCGCSNITTLDVSNWNISKVTSISTMFSGCSKLQSLDVSNWDTSNVTVMSSVFSNCRSLVSLDVSNWDTSKVTNMSSMFSNCRSLVSLGANNVKNWDVSNVRNFASFVYGLYSFVSDENNTLDMSNWNTDSIMQRTGSSQSYGFYYAFGSTFNNKADWEQETGLDAFQHFTHIKLPPIKNKCYVVYMFVSNDHLESVVAKEIGELDGTLSFTTNPLDIDSVRSILGSLQTITPETSTVAFSQSTSDLIRNDQTIMDDINNGVYSDMGWTIALN